MKITREEALKVARAVSEAMQLIGDAQFELSFDVEAQLALGEDDKERGTLFEGLGAAWSLLDALRDTAVATAETR